MSRRIRSVAHTDFLEPFPGLGIAARQWMFEIRVFLTLDELPSKADKVHLPEATDFKAPVIRPCPLLLAKTVPPREGQELDNRS